MECERETLNTNKERNLHQYQHVLIGKLYTFRGRSLERARDPCTPPYVYPQGSGDRLSVDLPAFHTTLTIHQSHGGMSTVWLHTTPYTLQPTPYTLHPTPCTLHPTPYTLHPTPFTINAAAQTLGGRFLDRPASTAHRSEESSGVHTPYTLHPTPYALHPTPYTLHPTPYTPRPVPHIRHSTPYRGTSLIRPPPPPQDRHRSLGMVLL